MFRQYFGLVLAAVAFTSVCFAGYATHYGYTTNFFLYSGEPTMRWFLCPPSVLPVRRFRCLVCFPEPAPPPRLPLAPAHAACFPATRPNACGPSVSASETERWNLVPVGPRRRTGEDTGYARGVRRGRAQERHGATGRGGHGGLYLY